MKKLSIAILVLCLMLTTFLTACKPKDDSASANLVESTPETSSVPVSSTPVSSSVPVSSTPESSSVNTKTTSNPSSSVNTSLSTGMTLADYAKQQNDIVSKSNNDIIKIQCTAKGTSLVYTYTYGIDVDKTTAQNTLNSLDSTYNNLLPLVKISVKECTSLIFEMKAKDGTILASKEYK